MIVTLTEEIKRRLLAIAHKRNDAKSPEQSRKKLKKLTDLEVDYIGVKGEYVGSVLLHVPFDEESYGRKGDTGIDLWLGPLPIGVKANHRPNGYLLVERRRDTDHVGVLLLIDGTCDPKADDCLCTNIEQKLVTLEPWRYVGWITVEDFWLHASWADWGLGSRWYIRQTCPALNRDLDQLYRYAYTLYDADPVVRYARGG